MARRPVFTPLGTRPHVREVSTEFTLHPGFSLKQEQRSVDSLHRSFLSAHPSARMLEVSGESPLVLGAELSAFRLEPRTFFYDWLYVSALAGHPELVNELEHRAAFTDIEFNPKRSINCQAHSVALFQGIAGGWRRDSLRPPDHPRSRGVYKMDRATVAPIDGSSPLARGLLAQPLNLLMEQGIIPARAGFTPRARTWATCTGDHPRSRGVYIAGPRTGKTTCGSSPLSRGLRPPSRSSTTSGSDHPRSRGVYTCAGPPPPWRPGSSPLARGLRNVSPPDLRTWRIIPARAGFTPSTPSRRSLVGGSSPLARGLPDRARLRRPDGRIIPARAGFTATPLCRCHGPWDHPRSRGVYKNPARRAAFKTGSSPLARGLPDA